MIFGENSGQNDIDTNISRPSSFSQNSLRQLHDRTGSTTVTRRPPTFSALRSAWRRLGVVFISGLVIFLCKNRKVCRCTEGFETPRFFKLVSVRKGVLVRQLGIAARCIRSSCWFHVRPNVQRGMAITGRSSSKVRMKPDRTKSLR